MDSDESRQSEVCHFSRLLLVSFLSIVVAITIARETKELKQLEECMMETQVDSKNRTRNILMYQNGEITSSSNTLELLNQE